MSSTRPPTADLAAHTFGRHHFSPPPLAESLERPALQALAQGQAAAEIYAADPDLDQRIRDVGEW